MGVGDVGTTSEGQTLPSEASFVKAQMGRDESSEDACLGEWCGRGKTIKVRRENGELLVDMGPGVPSLRLELMEEAASEASLQWAVVHQSSTTPGTVYIFELASPAASSLLVKKPSGDGVVEFERVGAAEDKEEPTESASPLKKAEKKKKKKKHRSRSPPRTGKQSFADSLVKIVSEKKVATGDRAKMAAAWRALETKLLSQAVEIFKKKCVREAESQRCSATISFEVLTRELDEFPKRKLSGSTYYVGDWGDGLSAEAWFYAIRGCAATFASGTQVLFAEVLQSMLPKFVDLCGGLGFDSCKHEAGTWKVTAKWQMPD